MTKKGIKFNANNRIRVKLTDYGREIWRKQRQLLRELVHTHEVSLELQEFDGWSKWQLWDFMRTFGVYISLSGPQVFECDIEIIHSDEDLAELKQEYFEAGIKAVFSSESSAIQQLFKILESKKDGVE
jgi:hypothetical protein